MSYWRCSFHLYRMNTSDNTYHFTFYLPPSPLSPATNHHHLPPTIYPLHPTPYHLSPTPFHLPPITYHLELTTHSGLSPVFHIKDGHLTLLGGNSEVVPKGNCSWFMCPLKNPAMVNNQVIQLDNYWNCDSEMSRCDVRLFCLLSEKENKNPGGGNVFVFLNAAHSDSHSDSAAEMKSRMPDLAAAEPQLQTHRSSEDPRGRSALSLAKCPKTRKSVSTRDILTETPTAALQLFSHYELPEILSVRLRWRTNSVWWRTRPQFPLPSRMEASAFIDVSFYLFTIYSIYNSCSPITVCIYIYLYIQQYCCLFFLSAASCLRTPSRCQYHGAQRRSVFKKNSCSFSLNIIRWKVRNIFQPCDDAPLIPVW